MKNFVKSILKQIRKRKKWYIELSKTVFSGMVGIIIVALLWVIFPEEGQTLQTTTVDIFPFLIIFFGGIVSNVVIKYLLAPFVFKSKKMKPIVFYFTILALFLGGFALIIELIGENEMMNVPVMGLLTVSGGYVVIYLLVRSIWRYLHTGTIRKDTKENRKRKKEEKAIKKDFNLEVSDKLVAKGMAKRYERLNKRNIRRKQEELAFAEFAKIIRKEEKKSKKTNRIMAFFCAAIVIGPAIMEMIITGFADGMILGSILAVVQIAVYRFFVTTNDKDVRQQLHIIEECERLGITITQYVNDDTV